MTELYPLTFKSIPKIRVWGGRKLETLYHKSLPPDVPVGETWEIVDRESDNSVIENGPLAGNTLHWLMLHHKKELLGERNAGAAQFPLLVKILDAREQLSLQVHPPTQVASSLGGEPKTEMWYVAQAEPGAEVYAGLKRGTTRSDFEAGLARGTVEQCFHRIPVKTGDALFLPSGRVHALGAGLVIFEIQQNSDSTYRVYDWNRVGLDGKPRDLHIAPSLQSIDFQDYEPSLVPGDQKNHESSGRRSLVNDPLFRVDILKLKTNEDFKLGGDAPKIIGLLEGIVSIAGSGQTLRLLPGQFCLVPACVGEAVIGGDRESSLLLIEF